MIDEQLLEELDNWMWEQSNEARETLKSSNAGLETKGALKGKSIAFLNARAKLFSLRKGFAKY